MTEEAVREILVINVSRIGDTLLATPAIRAIARAYAGARITCLAHPKRAEVLEHIDFIYRVGRVTKVRARIMGRLARRRYDLAFVYGYDRPLVAYAIRVAHRVIAFEQGDRAIDRRLWKAVPRPPFQAKHAVFLHMLLPEALGIAAAGYRLAYCVTDNERRWAQQALRGRVSADAEPLIGLQIASFPTKGYRDWPIENFVALCERVLEAYPRAHFAILGGPLERDRTAVLASRLGRNASEFAGRLTLRQSAAVMSCVDVYVGVDTGPTHIMGTLGAPMVVLYHCYSPSRLLAPLEHPALYAVDHPRPSAECSPQTPMGEITVEVAWHAFQAALASPVVARARGAGS